jgi:hypothetical protein
MPLTERIERFMNAFFSAGFNNDLNMNYPSAFSFKDGEITHGGMIGWSKHSEKNPMFGLSKDVEYKKHDKKTFGRMSRFVIDSHKGIVSND